MVLIDVILAGQRALLDGTSAGRLDNDVIAAAVRELRGAAACR
jgi:hypothetical protein